MEELCSCCNTPRIFPPVSARLSNNCPFQYYWGFFHFLLEKWLHLCATKQMLAWAVWLPSHYHGGKIWKGPVCWCSERSCPFQKQFRNVAISCWWSCHGYKRSTVGEIFIYYQILTAAVSMLDAGKIGTTWKSPSILAIQRVELQH